MHLQEVPDKVSVIIPCYNDGPTLRRTVESILRQSYMSVEVIIVDDGSDDETKKVISEIEPLVTKVLRQQNKGQAAARNLGIASASGKYILPIDSDDYVEESFCSQAVQQFTDETIKIVTCQAIIHRLNGETYVFTPEGGKLNDFLYRNGALGTSMFRKQDWEAVRGYDETMRKGWEDWEFFIRLLRSGGKTAVIYTPLYHYFRGVSRTTGRANLNKYDLMEYLYLKHRDLYMADYDRFVIHLLNIIRSAQEDKIKGKKSFRSLLGRIKRKFK